VTVVSEQQLRRSTGQTASRCRTITSGATDQRAAQQPPCRVQRRAPIRSSLKTLSSRNSFVTLSEYSTAPRCPAHHGVVVACAPPRWPSPPLATLARLQRATTYRTALDRLGSEARSRSPETVTWRCCHHTELAHTSRWDPHARERTAEARVRGLARPPYYGNCVRL
jgi:hypothetical protein